MRVSLVTASDAAQPVHDLARKVEDAFELAMEVPNAGAFTYKSDVIDRMTDAQLGVFETQLEQTSVRMRQKWYAIQAVYHRADDFPLFYGLFVDFFGKAETDRILKASNRA